DAFVPIAQVDSTTATSAPHAAQAQKSQNVRYIHTDHLGTPRELTSGSGEIVWAGVHKAWGNLAIAAMPAIQVADDQDTATEPSAFTDVMPLRFQGQYYDSETGLHYNRFRYYDPDSGRFVSQDPIGLQGGNNLYQYAPNPTVWIDPLGLAGYTVGAQTAGGDALSRGVHVNVNGAGLPSKGGHIGIIPNATGDGVALVPADKATRDLNPRQWEKATESVREYLNNPKNVDRMEKAAQAGIDAYPNSSRTTEMAKVRDILNTHKSKGTCPCL
ncbi:RHS repeat-associated core domain-containing protein, partial [Herbaspirillum sp. GCM10030257]|uniref:RHS repeat-associated core domain-containing protein n=1 Tax=Herbaspirillum sp. GCM10030257 TaxID=3273393 RepID=UPI00361C8076